MKKILIAMSHKLQEKQVDNLLEIDYQPILSDRFVELGCNRLAPTLTSDELLDIAILIVNEAVSKGCTAIAMTGEPMLTFHTWNKAKEKGLQVLQSTTERKTVEVEQTDGTMLKTKFFDHVQWRLL